MRAKYLLLLLPIALGAQSTDNSVLLSKAVSQSGSPFYCPSSSASGTTYTCAVTPSVSSLTTGMVIYWKPDVNGTGGATTLNISSRGAKSVKEADGSTNPTSSDIVGGQLYPVWYDGTVIRLISTSGGGGGGGVTLTSPSSTLSISGSGTSSLTADVSPSWLGGEVSLLNPGSGANTYTAGINNIFKASASQPGASFAAAPNPSSTTPGWFNIDASGGWNWMPNTTGPITLAASPSAPRTVSIPDANSNTVQPLTCGTGLVVTAISSSGVVTCSATNVSASNCASSASPAVCGSATAGSVAFPTGVTSVALTVNTTAVTANSQIFLFADDSLGSRLGVTCNSTLATLTGGMAITARSAGTSFTVTYNGSIATNPLCVSYQILN